MMSRCKFCNKEITWIKEGRKNVPIEGDGAVHRCDEMKNSLKSIKQLDPESMREEIKRYERQINKKKN
jgi:hypothetical protein